MHALDLQVMNKHASLSVVFLLLVGCMARPTVKVVDIENHKKQNQVIVKRVLEVGKTGDWLVTRGYHATDDLVANATGIPISHVGVFNRELLKVVEAEGKGVHLTNLDGFVNKSYRLIIIRPRWRTEKNSREVWLNAEKMIGKNYDFLGTIGFNYPEMYYCSELAVSVYSNWFGKNVKFPTVIKPGELYLYGVILYDSLPRDEI